jgi:hypothetical protein
MSTITIHHVRETGVKADLHLYCGRNHWKYPHLTNAGLGNPFEMTHEDMRNAVCEAYKLSLEQDWQPHREQHLKVIQRIALRLSEGKSVALYCHCYPQACHCDVIKRRALETITP